MDAYDHEVLIVGQKTRDLEPGSTRVSRRFLLNRLYITAVRITTRTRRFIPTNDSDMTVSVSGPLVSAEI